MQLIVIDNIRTKVLVHRFMSQIKKYCDYEKSAESNERYFFSKEKDYSHFERFDLLKQDGNGTVFSGCDDNYEMQDCKYHYVPNQYVTWLCEIGLSEKTTCIKRENIQYILAKPQWNN